MIDNEFLNRFPIILFTDGACKANGSKRSVGGWAYVLLYESMKKEIRHSNFEQPTTNNRMEIKSILSGLQDIKNRWRYPYPKIAVVSDSKYCIHGASTWMYSWRRNGWKKREKLEKIKPLVNVDLWKEMFDLCKILKPEFYWVKGHSGNKYNEICDTLSTTAVSLRQEYLKNVRNPV
jgi:ribonuclease HI